MQSFRPLLRAIPRPLVRVVHERDRLQPHRHDAAQSLGKDANARRAGSSLVHALTVAARDPEGLETDSGQPPPCRHRCVYRCANAEARRSAPGKGWKLNRSKSACLLTDQKLCRTTVAFWRKCDTALPGSCRPQGLSASSRARVTKGGRRARSLEKEGAGTVGVTLWATDLGLATSREQDDPPRSAWSAFRPIATPLN